MKRVIVEYTKLTKDILDLLIDKYPDGYGGYDDIIKFQNGKGETIRAVEVRTIDTIYLVKISDQLEKTMESYSEDEDFFDDKGETYFEDMDSDNI